MTIKLIPSQAHIFWNYGARDSTDETFKLQLVQIKEFMGNDSVLDDRSEFGGITYNLIKNDWTYDIDLTPEELTVTLTLTDFLNGSDMSVIMHVYNYDTPIPDTNDTVDALKELKFDIIVNDWVFSPGAQGYAIQSYITEIEHHHEVSIRNGTVAENGDLKRTMFFMDSQLQYEVVAYYEWLNFAKVYNNGDILIDTIDVGTAFFNDSLAVLPEDIPGFAEGLAHVYFTYPNYGDDNKMIHDPTIGVIDLDPDVEPTSLSSVYLISILSGLFATASIAFIIKRKK
ncbi:MAG: hypothetical protein ACTSO7_05480 [Candidatus Heimdallarchaeota archaeon]